MVNKHECYAAFFNTEKVENHILGGKDEAYEKETQILCHCCLKQIVTINAIY